MLPTSQTYLNQWKTRFLDGGKLKGSDLTVPGQWRWVGAEAGGHLGSGR